MSDVSVVGLGSMGSALARALVGAGREVTVWNRTSAKAEVLTSVTVEDTTNGISKTFSGAF
jgi:3-hydroxyisobutyrate dehydrogenase-like beta-hydroxyacid dehydrogenase